MQSNFKDFFKEGFNIDCESMKEKEIVDVEEHGIEVLSFNIKNKENEFRKVNKVVRKPDSYTYTFLVGNDKIEVTKDHMFYIKIDKEPTYMEVSHIIKMFNKNKIHILNIDNEFVSISKIEKSDKKYPIYDMEVDGNNNFYTSGYLSHNTMFGNPEVVCGGNALKFYASVRLDIRRSITTKNSVMEDGVKMGNQVTVKVVKNKVSPPFRQCEFDILYGEGIDSYGELVKMALDLGMIQKSGTWFSYNDTKLGQGVLGAIQFLKEDSKMCEEIKERVIESYTPLEFEPEKE